MATKNRHMFELRLGKLGLILFIGGMSLLLFSMFLLGIVVGKHLDTYPEKYPAGIADLIYDRLFASAPQGGRVSTSSKPGVKGDPAAGEESFGLTFYETLGGKKGGTPTGKAAGAVKNPPPETSAPMPIPTENPLATGPSSVAARGSGTAGNMATPIPNGGGEGKKSNSLPEKKPAVASGPKIPAAITAGITPDGGGTPENGRFEIQVAAYQDNRKAEQMLEKLKPLGFSSRVVMKDLPAKGTWFRVIVSGFESRAKAKAAADQISGKVRGVNCLIRSSAKRGAGAEQ
jgi:cell division septation protein DedD